MDVVQSSCDLDTLSFGPVHEVCHTISYGNVTVEKCYCCSDSDLVEKTEMF